MKGAILFLLLTFCGISTANAQLTKMIHQTFETAEANRIELNLYGEYEIEKWAGNTIMTETSIELYEASNNILKHFTEAGRWDIEEDQSETSVKLTSVDLERRTLRTKAGECFEIIKMKIYVPEEFKIVNNNLLERSAESDITVKKDE